MMSILKGPLLTLQGSVEEIKKDFFPGNFHGVCTVLKIPLIQCNVLFLELVKQVVDLF